MSYMIDLRRLQVLRAVAHYGTVTAAAEAMHFTPSAASQKIRQLGRELGVVLLEPRGRRVRLTPAAQSLLAHADVIQMQWEQAEIDLRAARDEPAGLLRVCGFPVAVATLLAPLAATLRVRHPRLTVHVRQTELRNGYDLLFDGEVDLAVTEATPGNPSLADPRFDQQPLLDDAFDLVVPTRHPLAGRTDVALSGAATEDWVLPLPGSTCHTHTISACTAAGFNPSVAHHALEWNAIAALVAHGLGVALIPRLAHLAPHPPVTRVPLRGRPVPSRKLLTCARAGSSDHPAIVAARAALSAAAPACVD